MDRVMSTRMDESFVPLVDTLVKELHLSKKKVFEMAIQNLWDDLHSGSKKNDIFSQTFGAMASRAETIDQQIENQKAVFRKGFERHR